MHVTLSADKEKIVMIEAGADEVPEDIMLDAIKKGHEEIKRIVSLLKVSLKKLAKKSLNIFQRLCHKTF